jgi:hypothetical protein
MTCGSASRAPSFGISLFVNFAFASLKMSSKPPSLIGM